MGKALFLLLALPQDPGEEVDRLIRALGSIRPEERLEAERRLIERGPAALEALRRAARDDDPEVATRAKLVASILRTADRLPGFLLKRSPLIARRIARGADRACVDALLECASSWRGDPNLQPVDLGFLVPRAIPRVTSDEEADAIRTIAYDFDMRSAIPGLVRLLEEGELHDAERARQTLATLSAREAVPGLVALLRSEDRWELAAQILKDLAAVEAADDIAKLLDDADLRVQRNAAVTLGLLGEQRRALAVYRRLLHARDPRLRREGAAGLTDAVFHDALHPLLGLLEDPDAGVRETAVQQLVRIGRREAIPAIAARIRDERAVRMAAFTALRSLDAREAIPQLRAALKSPHGEVRFWAVHLLVRFNATEAAPDLRKLFADRSFIVARDAKRTVRAWEQAGLIDRPR